MGNDLQVIVIIFRKLLQSFNYARDFLNIRNYYCSLLLFRNDNYTSYLVTMCASFCCRIFALLDNTRIHHFVTSQNNLIINVLVPCT